MKIRIIPIPYGDSFVISWSGKQGEHTLLLDSGTANAYKCSLRGILQRLNHEIDLWIISHPHDDHIGGVMKYIDDLQGGLKLPQCKRWLYNQFEFDAKSPSVYTDGSIAESKKQSDKLSSFLVSHAFKLEQVSANIGKSLKMDGLEITVVTPIEIGCCNDSVIKPYSVAVAANCNDYFKQINDFNIFSIKEDVSEINKSCMSLIVRHNNHTFFWTADALPSQITLGLRMLGYNEENPLKCDCATLPHHGSKANLDLMLLSLISCENFVVTANGENKYLLPTKEAFVKVLKNPCRSISRHLTFIFPEQNETLESMFVSDGEDIFKKFNFEMKFPRNADKKESAYEI